MRALLATLVVVAACHDSPVSTSAPDACAVVKAAECCDGRGCASGPGTLNLTVLDASTSQPVDGTIMFTSPMYEGPLPFTCSTSASPCPSWTLAAGPLGLSSGSLPIALSATGYQPATYTATLSEPTGCCGWGEPTDATVSLTR